MAIQYRRPGNVEKQTDRQQRDLEKTGKSETGERGPHEKHKAMSRMAQEIAEHEENPPSRDGKKLVSIRYDMDILTYFQSTGQKWQTRMNEVLRAYVNEQREKGN